MPTGSSVQVEETYNIETDDDLYSAFLPVHFYSNPTDKSLT